jgi:hypothetical protein
MITRIILRSAWGGLILSVIGLVIGLPASAGAAWLNQSQPPSAVKAQSGTDLTRTMIPITVDMATSLDDSDLFPSYFRACFRVTAYIFVGPGEGSKPYCSVNLLTLSVPETIYDKFKRDIGKERGYKPNDMAMCEDLRDFAISGKQIQADVFVGTAEGVWPSISVLYFGNQYCPN